MEKSIQELLIDIEQRQKKLNADVVKLKRLVVAVDNATRVATSVSHNVERRKHKKSGS